MRFSNPARVSKFGARGYGRLRAQGCRHLRRLAHVLFLDVHVWPYAAHQVETADWHTARSGSGGSTSVLLGVSEYDLDERAADPRIRNRREVDLSLVHVGVACCHWTIVGSVAVCD
jgi:hypothetical protein